MEKIARCVQTIKGVPICLDVEDIDESDDVANDQGRQYNACDKRRSFTASA
jgi:hypothetical protein